MIPIETPAKVKCFMKSCFDERKLIRSTSNLILTISFCKKDLKDFFYKIWEYEVKLDNNLMTIQFWFFIRRRLEISVTVFKQNAENHVAIMIRHAQY